MRRILGALFVLFVLVGCSPTFPFVYDPAAPNVIPTVVLPVPQILPMPGWTATPEPTKVCDIKGNLTPGKIYHMPGQPTYNQTKVEPEKGDKWFCSEDDAIKAGFRKAKR